MRAGILARSRSTARRRRRITFGGSGLRLWSAADRDRRSDLVRARDRRLRRSLLTRLFGCGLTWMEPALTIVPGTEDQMSLSVGQYVWIPCEVKPGPFSDQRIVHINSPSIHSSAG